VSSPALSHAEGKAAAAWASGAYGGVRGHGQAARTPLAAFFNTPYSIQKTLLVWLAFRLAWLNANIVIEKLLSIQPVFHLLETPHGVVTS